MAKIFGFYDDWKTEVLECPICGWKGTFYQGGVSYDIDIMDSSCPECAPIRRSMLAIVGSPTIEEAEQNWSKLTEEEKARVVARRAFLKDFKERWEAAHLKSPDQLPELAGEEITMVWDWVEDNGKDITVIRHGDAEIWREPAIYEGYERFRDVVCILRQKYGKRLVDVVPTCAGGQFLHGDHCVAPGKVIKETRQSLKEC
jgi:hypothetical protein